MYDLPAPADLPGLLRDLAAVERDAAAVAARRVRVLAAIHAAEQSARLVEAANGLGPVGSESAVARDRHWISEEVGLILRVAGVTAQDRLLHADQLVTRLPDAVGLLEHGELHPAQAQRLSEAVIALTDEQCAAVQERVLAKVAAAAHLSITGLTRTLKRAVLIAAPRTAERAHEAAVAEQRVELRPLDHGMALILAWLPAPAALRVKAHLDARARVNRATGAALLSGEQPCCADQRRALALIELIDLGARATTDTDAGVTPSRPGAAVQVTVSLDTLQGGCEPGELAATDPSQPASPASSRPTRPAPGPGWSPTQ